MLVLFFSFFLELRQTAACHKRRSLTLSSPKDESKSFLPLVKDNCAWLSEPETKSTFDCRLLLTVVYEVQRSLITANSFYTCLRNCQQTGIIRYTYHHICLYINTGHTVQNALVTSNSRSQSVVRHTARLCTRGRVTIRKYLHDNHRRSLVNRVIHFSVVFFYKQHE